MPPSPPPSPPRLPPWTRPPTPPNPPFTDPLTRERCYHNGKKCWRQPPTDNGMPLNLGRPANCSADGLRKRYLMVPKSGCESAVYYFGATICAPHQRHRGVGFGAGSKSGFGTPSHYRFYEPCSIAQLREPCDRAVSVFRHLKCMYSLWRPSALQHGTMWCKRDIVTRKRCENHWIHGVASADAFALALRDRWPSLLSLEHVDLFERHLIVAMPQSMYIGPRSWVLCTHRLETDLPDLARVICPSRLENIRSVPHVSHNLQQCEKSVKWDHTPLSEAGCAIIRGLYRQDYVLWQRHCATAVQNRTTALA